MIQSAETILNQLQQKVFSPVYFLQGEEPYYIESITRYIENNILLDTQKTFDLTIYYGKECNMGAVIEQARRYPISADRQVVIVKEAQDMLDFKKSVGQKLLENYLQRPQLSTLLVFAYKSKALDSRNNFKKLLEQQTIFMHAKKIADQKLPHFIKSFADSLQLSITDKAIWMIHAYIGNNLIQIANELNKLHINLMPGDTITESIINAYIGFNKIFNVFELQDAIMQKNYSQAYRIINNCSYHTKESAALPMLTVLFTFFSKLLMLHSLPTASPSYIAQTTAIHPYFINQFIKAKKTIPLHKFYKI